MIEDPSFDRDLAMSRIYDSLRKVGVRKGFRL